ncbi:MAG: NUDIX hydrolase [Steroidobacteraceae bacterium]
MTLESSEPAWLTIARELQALAQTGLAFSNDPFDLQRFQRTRELAAQLMALGSDASAEKILGLFERDVGYTTPKIDVRGAAFIDENILLVQEATDGLWTLPGGWADVNQSAAECVVREISEESGFQARATKLVAVCDYRKSGHPPRRVDSIYKMFFLCDITGGEARTSVETTGVAFFPHDQLPPLSLGRITAAQIERVFRHHRQRNLPTEFD